MKVKLILIMLIVAAMTKAQNINNNILGKYISKNKSDLYETFTFYNNGKVQIAEFANGDYFIKGDTLIIFPDKSMFKFIVKEDELSGISEWVKNGKWVLSKEKVTDKRINNDSAKKNALLLNEYYEKTRMKDNQMEILFDEKLKNEYLNTIESLCDRGLIRACKEVFGMETLEQMGGVENVVTNGKSNDLKTNPKLLNIANNVLKIDSSEGYNLLFLYYTMIKQTDKAKEAMEMAISLGNKETILTQMNMELVQTSNEIEKISENETLTEKSNYEPLFISTLRLFNQLYFSEIEQDLKSRYGFKLIDKTISSYVEIRDYENAKYSRITKFQYKDIKQNRIEYATKSIEEINSFKQDLSSYKKTEVQDAKTGEIREDYKLEIKLDKGYVQNCHIQILYPPKDKTNEPTTILLFE